MWTNKKLSQAPLSRVIQSEGFFSKKLGNMMVNLGKKALLDLAAPFAKNVLPILATKTTSSVLDKMKIEISAKVAIRASKKLGF